LGDRKNAKGTEKVKEGKKEGRKGSWNGSRYTLQRPLVAAGSIEGGYSAALGAVNVATLVGWPSSSCEHLHLLSSYGSLHFNENFVFVKGIFP